MMRLTEGTNLVRKEAVSVWTAPAASGAIVFTQYLYADGTVRLVGEIVSTSGTIAIGTVVCTVDAAFRPLDTKRFLTVTSTGSFAYGTVNTDGTLAFGVRAIVQDGEHPNTIDISYTRNR